MVMVTDKRPLGTVSYIVLSLEKALFYLSAWDIRVTTRIVRIVKFSLFQGHFQLMQNHLSRVAAYRKINACLTPFCSGTN